MKIFRIFLALATLGLLVGAASAQTNPQTQITWPRVTGAGVPTATCPSSTNTITTATVGTPYTNTTANTQYVCSTGGWTLLAGGSGGGTANFPTTGAPCPVYVTGNSATSSICETSSTVPGGPYLPLSGGTLTGVLDGTTGNFSTSVITPILDVTTINGSVLNLAAQTADTFYGAPCGSGGVPVFRVICPTDLPLATTGAFGAVKPDGTTITISAGVISASGGGGSGITALTGDVTATGPGSAAASVVKVNGASVPVSQPSLASNSSGQLIAGVINPNLTAPYFASPLYSFGDSICGATGASVWNTSYNGILYASHDGIFTTVCFGGATASDNAVEVGGTIAYTSVNTIPSPVTLLEAGTNDVSCGNTAGCIAVYTNTTSFAVAYAGMSDTQGNRVRAPAMTVDGTFAADTTDYTLPVEVSTTSGGVASWTCVSTGNGCGVAYVVTNTNGGVMGCKVDTGSATSINLFPTSPAIIGTNHPYTYYRTELTAAAGTHTITCTVTSSTSSVNRVALVMGDSFPTGSTSTLPRVDMTTVPAAGGVTSAVAVAYSAAATTLEAAFVAEGANVKLADLLTASLLYGSNGYSATAAAPCLTNAASGFQAGGLHPNDCPYYAFAQAFITADPQSFIYNNGQSIDVNHSYGLPPASSSAYSTGNLGNVFSATALNPGGLDFYGGAYGIDLGAYSVHFPEFQTSGGPYTRIFGPGICFTSAGGPFTSQASLDTAECTVSNEHFFWTSTTGLPTGSINYATLHSWLNSRDNQSSITVSGTFPQITDAVYVGPLTGAITLSLPQCNNSPITGYTRNYSYQLFRVGSDGNTVTFTVFSGGGGSPADIINGVSSGTYAWTASQPNMLTLLCSDLAVGGSNWTVVPSSTSGGSSTTFQVNGTGLTSSTTVNYRTGTGNGGVVFTNPSAGNVDANLSLPIAGSGGGFTTGPNSGVTPGDLALFTGTLGQITDGAIAGSAVVTLTGTQTLTNKSISGAQINSGTIPAAQLPLATTGAFGAVKPDGTTITISGGVISSTALSNPMTTLGDTIYGGGGGTPTRLLGPGINGTYNLCEIPTSGVAVAPVWCNSPLTKTAVASNFLTGYSSTTGVFSFAQPAFTDISGTAAAAQLPLATTGVFGAVKPDGTTITISGGVISASGGGAPSLSSITAATSANTIANGNNPQNWNFAQTTASQVGFSFGETTAASGTGDIELQAKTLAGSTAVPFQVVDSLTGTQILPAMQILPTWNTSGVVDAALMVNVTNTASGTGSLIEDLQIGGTSVFKVDKIGDTTVAESAPPTTCANGTGFSLTGGSRFLTWCINSSNAVHVLTNFGVAFDQAPSAPQYETLVTTITASATPAIVSTNGLQTITLNANATPTISGIAAGQHVTIQICQPASGGPFTWAWPTAVHGGVVIGTTASTCSQQSFYSWTGTTLVATDTGTINLAP